MIIISNGGAKDFGELACFSSLPSTSFTLWEALGDSKLSVPSGSLTSSIGFSSLVAFSSSKSSWAANISRSPWASSSGVALVGPSIDMVALQGPRFGLITQWLGPTRFSTTKLPTSSSTKFCSSWFSPEACKSSYSSSWELKAELKHVWVNALANGQLPAIITIIITGSTAQGGGGSFKIGNL